MVRTLFLRFCFASLLAGCVLAFTSPALAQRAVENFSDQQQQFLDDLERRTFNFFWETTNASNGLVPDRWPSDSPCSIAAVGFGLTAYGVGVERGYITRDQAVERVLATLRFFKNAPQNDSPRDVTGYRGFYYHFLSMDDGTRSRQCELSSIDTALLIAGVLFCREYFDGENDAEQEIRTLADQLYRDVQWNWMQPRPPLICMAWRPERDFGDHEYRGYNEAMILYVLALGSPTHAIDPAVWPAYTSTYQWKDFYGQEHVNFTPLFGHQYSHVWIDFREIQDPEMRERGIDYFENSRRATLAQQAYAADNPNNWQDYSDKIWGLTACDGPAGVELPYQGETRRFHTYMARGASAENIIDDGTIAPTAAGGSIAFTPQESLAALMHMKQQYGDDLYQQYGFLDSFNPSFTFEDVDLRHGQIVEGKGWINDDYLGIDQGPIVLMIENLRSELIWEVLRKSPYIQTGLKRAGFTGGWIDASE